MLSCPLPFFNERRTAVNMLMFHCSALSADGMIATLKEKELSCHYIIAEDGTVISVVDEDKRAWHGGVGFWREIDADINSHSVGIELCHPDMGQSPYSDAQIDALIALSRNIISRYGIRPQYIVGHSDCAPERKPDPGKCFPWQRLALQGIGLWYDEQKRDKRKNVRSLLAEIGYDTRSERAFKASQYAFARRFAPELISVDTSLKHLIETVFPDDTDFAGEKHFLHILQTVSQAYKDSQSLPFTD